MSASPRLILVGGPDEEAETPGEDRVENFNEMPPYLQASILSVRDPVLRGRLMDDQDLAETCYQYGQAAQRLRAADPSNILLDTIHSPDWLPTDEDVASLQAASRAVRPQRPLEPWRQSEEDVGAELGADACRQTSFKDGDEADYGTPRSVRPDFVINGNIASVEVKRCNISTNANALISNVAPQAIERAEHLPAGMEQRIVIDIRGQDVSEEQQWDITNAIVTRSKGILKNSSIRFKTQDQS